jgi:hypothetical protein
MPYFLAMVSEDRNEILLSGLISTSSFVVSLRARSVLSSLATQAPSLVPWALLLNQRSIISMRDQKLTMNILRSSLDFKVDIDWS